MANKVSASNSCIERFKEHNKKKYKKKYKVYGALISAIASLGGAGIGLATRYVNMPKENNQMINDCLRQLESVMNYLVKHANEINPEIRNNLSSMILDAIAMLQNNSNKKILDQGKEILYTISNIIKERGDQNKFEKVLFAINKFIDSRPSGT